MKITGLLAVALAWAFAGATGAHGQEPGGCLDVALGPWAPVSDPSGYPTRPVPSPDVVPDSMVYAFPPRIRLTDEPVGSRWPGHLVEVPAGSLPTLHAWRSWLVADGTLTLVLSTGFSGVQVVAVPEGNGWRGTLETRSDVAGLLRYRRPVLLREADCDSPPPVPASADRVLLRSVELASGAVLRLGAPVPEGLTTEPRHAGVLRVVATTTGLLAGADTILIEGDGAHRVSMIQMVLSGDADIDALIQTLEARIGPGEPGRGNGMSWQNRTTSVYVTAGTSMFPHHRVILIDPRYRRR